MTYPQPISLTCDLWQNRNSIHFLTLTAHFFDLNHEFVSLIVSFRRFRGQKLSERLKNFIKSELYRLDITNKIISITTDSGAYIKKATNGDDFGLRVSCLAHKLNLTIKNSSEILVKTKVKYNFFYQFFNLIYKICDCF